ncbi:MAG TPA: glycosyltransferase [Blastocatellia bacterium]|nr:glycosyltransferase [Blastocatellia bacterium]
MSISTEKKIAYRVQTERVFKWWDYPLFIALTFINLSAVAYFLVRWLSLKGWVHDPLSFSVFALILCVAILNYEARWFLLIFMKRPRPIAARPGWRVAVVTTFVKSGESLDMIENTLKAMVALSYPHDSWILDEEDDDHVKALCEKYGVKHFSRKSLDQYQADSGVFSSRSKHGNYNTWLHEIGFDRYEIIAAFDPDHVALPNFLHKVLGYFEDSQVAYVQAAQAYYNQKASFIARGAAEETYAYYSSVQMASYGLGYPIVIGCHNTHRVEALKQAGGFPPHDADDMLLTLIYRAKGWQGVYVPEILARGLTPVDWSGYLTQQQRWSRSVLDIKFRQYFKLYDKLPLQTRVISFLHGFNYLYKNFTILIALIFLVFMLATGIAPRILSTENTFVFGYMIVALWLCDFYRQRFYLDPRNEWGIHWRAALLQIAKWPYVLLAFYEVIVNRRTPYALTIKVGRESRRYMLVWPHLLVTILICSAWVFGAVTGRHTNPYIHLVGAVVVTGFLALILTEFSPTPPPYDRRLNDRER